MSKLMCPSSLLHLYYKPLIAFKCFFSLFTLPIIRLRTHYIYPYRHWLYNHIFCVYYYLYVPVGAVNWQIYPYLLLQKSSANRPYWLTVPQSWLSSLSGSFLQFLNLKRFFKQIERAFFNFHCLNNKWILFSQHTSIFFDKSGKNILNRSNNSFGLASLLNYYLATLQISWTQSSPMQIRMCVKKYMYY